MSKRKSPSSCSIEHRVGRDPHLWAGDVPHQLRVLDHDRAVVEEPDLHRSSYAFQGLANGDELRCPLSAELVDLLRRVVVDAAPRLHAELALCDPVADRRRDLARRGQVLVEVGADRVVDVEPGHVEQLHRADHGQLVADPPADVQIHALRVDDAAVDQIEALAKNRVEDAVLDEAGHLLLDHRVVAESAHELARLVDHTLFGLLTGDHLDHRDEVRRIRPVHADDALGVRAYGSDLRDRDTGGVRGEDRVLGHVLFELRKDLVLQLELLRHRLHHQLRAVQCRSELGLEAHRPTGCRRRLETIEHALGHLNARLGTLQCLGADVTEDGLDSRPREHCAHPRAHGPRTDDRCTSHFGHVSPSFRSWIRRQTRSGVNGSSVTGTPASATAVATAAVTAAREPSPQPLAP